MTSLAAALRAIAADPSPLNLSRLPIIAISVERYERLGDELFRDAREDERLIRLFTQKERVP